MGWVSTAGLFSLPFFYGGFEAKRAKLQAIAFLIELVHKHRRTQSVVTAKDTVDGELCSVPAFGAGGPTHSVIKNGRSFSMFGCCCSRRRSA